MPNTIDASAHCEIIFKSKHARKPYIPVTEIVNLSIPKNEQLLRCQNRQSQLSKTRLRVNIKDRYLAQPEEYLWFR